MEQIRPSKGWYVLSALILVAGIGFAVLFGVRAYVEGNTEQQVLRLPGENTVYVQAPGRYQIYYIFYMSYVLRQDVTFTFISDDGVAVDSRYPTYSSNFQAKGRNGVLVSVVDFERPGRYLVRTNYQDGPEVEFIIGSNMVRGPVVNILSAIGCAMGGIVLSAVLSIIVAVRRSFARKRPGGDAPARPPDF